MDRSHILPTALDVRNGSFGFEAGIVVLVNHQVIREVNKSKFKNYFTESLCDAVFLMLPQNLSHEL